MALGRTDARVTTKASNDRSSLVWRGISFGSWFDSRLIQAGLAILIIAGGILAFYDPFDVDDRPHIERLLELALSNAKAEIVEEVEARTWAQVELAVVDNVSSMPLREWERSSDLFLARNPGYIGLQLLDNTYHIKRAAELPEATGLTTAVDVLDDARLRHIVQTAAASTAGVATAPISLANGRSGYLIAVPTYDHGEITGFLVVVADIKKTLDSMFSEFKDLSYSVAVLDKSQQLYEGGPAENRKKWGLSGKLPLAIVDWQIEVWPKNQMLAEARSSLPELVAIFTVLLMLLLVSTIHLTRQLHTKSVLLGQAHDELESRVRDRTAELELANSDLRNLSAHVLNVQDQERRRIARELHDGTVQTLTALKINVDNLRKSTLKDNSSSTQLLNESGQLAQQALSELRSLSHLLHPPVLEDFGLESALSWYAAGFGKRSNIRVQVEICADLGRLPRDLELILFRIAQESLGNIHRHSGSRTAKVSLARSSSNVTLVVSDEGCGLPKELLDSKPGATPHLGVGIAGMRERVRQFDGRLEITSTSSGTIVRVVLPVGEPSRKDAPR